MRVVSDKIRSYDDVGLCKPVQRCVPLNHVLEVVFGITIESSNLVYTFKFWASFW